jgi:predicted RNA methylase
MYSASGYWKMIADEVRMGAYTRALRNAVKPGSVVADLGTGTGIFALLACRIGARRVFAIEPNNIIQVAQELAAANGCANRIQFIQQESMRVDLPERADVLVSDLRGILPYWKNHLPSILDARRRFLKPQGVMIPERDTLWAAPVEASELYRDLQTPCMGEVRELDLQLIRRLAIQTIQKAYAKPERLLAAPICWAMLDYTKFEEFSARATVTWTISRSSTGHGFLAWFDAELGNGAQFSNAPGAPPAIYGCAFFPWSVPVTLIAGDCVRVELEAIFLNGDYVWKWETNVMEQGRAGSKKDSFQQSTLWELALPGPRLRNFAEEEVPTVDEEERIDQVVLELMDGGRSLGEIARQLAARFPERFLTLEEALNRVGALSRRHSR